MRRGNNIIVGGLRTKWGRIMGLALATGALLWTASPALGLEDRRYGDHGPDRNIESLRDREQYGPDRRDFRGKRDDDKLRIGFQLNTGDLRIGARRWEEPCYEERRARVWVPPVYKTVCDKVWVEPVVKHECERVWVPARHEWRTVTRRDRHGCLVKVRERVCVRPGHYKDVHRDVVVVPGHWDTVERQELVCAGHYEWRTERVKVHDGGWRNQTVVKFDVD